MIGHLPETQFQGQNVVNNLPSKVRSDYDSTGKYFKHLASDVSDLKKTLALPGGDEILNAVDEATGDTLLHIIAEGTPREFTFAVAPYLTDKRVAAQNHQGNTVLHNHIKFIGNKECWHQTMDVYLKHSDGGATLSKKNNEGETALARFYIYQPWDPYVQRPSVTEMLLKKGLPNLDFNAPCANGLTVLTLAISENRYDDAITLLNNGASPVFLGEDQTKSAEYVLKAKQQQISERIAASSEVEEIFKGSSPCITKEMKEKLAHPEAFQKALDKLNLIEDKINNFTDLNFTF
jgi:hypothetical protein